MAYENSLFTPTCDLPPYNCIQPPAITHTRPVFIYIWEDFLGYSDTPPGKSDLPLIANGCLHVLQVIGSHCYVHNHDGNLYLIDQVVDYGDFHSTELPF